MNLEGKGESPQYQEIRSPPVPVQQKHHQPLTQSAFSKDPFGTFRASLKWRKKKNAVDNGKSIKALMEEVNEVDDDDVFLPSSTITGHQGELKRPTSCGDPFRGTLRGGNSQKECDYRESNNNQLSMKRAAIYAEELTITNDLLYMLEAFKMNSYSVKEMETMFDQWKKKAGAVSCSEEFKEKTKVRNTL